MRSIYNACLPTKCVVYRSHFVKPSIIFSVLLKDRLITIDLLRRKNITLNFYVYELHNVLKEEEPSIMF
jgi:hypothetical protein